MPTLTCLGQGMLMQRHFMSLHIGITLKVGALLLEYNADPDKPRSDGATPLYIASANITLK